MKPKQLSSKTQTRVGSVILALLTLIIISLFFVQSDFNPAVEVRREQLSAANAVQPRSIQPIIAIPDRLDAMTPPEMFTPDTLFEKINGQAELYLGAGFEQMRCQRFVIKDNPEAWFELFIYDMASGSNAFAVYSSQRRNDAATLDLAQYAYKTDNALFAVHGPYYLELVASQSSQIIFSAMEAAALSFMNVTKVAEQTTPGSNLFPEKNLDLNTLILIAANVFGFDQLDQVYTANYTIDGAPIKAFVSKRRTADEARRLADGYYQFLTNFGGNAVAMQTEISEARMVSIMDTYEIIFSTGVYLAGVHEAENQAAAQQLARQLYMKLNGG